jgi:predicted transcriptional regulator
MTPDSDLVARRAEIVAEIEESIAQLDRGEFVTEEELRAHMAARRAARADSQAIPCPS